MMVGCITNKRSGWGGLAAKKNVPGSFPRVPTPRPPGAGLDLGSFLSEFRCAALHTGNAHLLRVQAHNSAVLGLGQAKPLEGVEEHDLARRGGTVTELHVDGLQSDAQMQGPGRGGVVARWGMRNCRRRFPWVGVAPEA